MVTAGPHDVDSSRRLQAGHVNILQSNGKDGLRDQAPIYGKWYLPECGLCDPARWLRWLDLRFDYFGMIGRR
jgi:hypothetical protein